MAAPRSRGRHDESAAAGLAFAPSPSAALLLLLLLLAGFAILPSHAGWPTRMRLSDAAVPAPKAPPPQQGRADPTDFREYLLPPPPAKLWPRWSLLEPDRNLASLRWAQCLARDVAYIAPYTCNLRWRDSMGFCALLVTNKPTMPSKPGLGASPPSDDNQAAATAIAAADVLDTRDYVRMMSFEPYISCLEKSSAEYRPSGTGVGEVFTCSSRRQWPTYDLESLSRAKTACKALLPESLVEPPVTF